MTTPKLPATVEIGPLIYTVEATEAAIKDACINYGSTNLAGHSDHALATISVDPKQAPSQMRDTVLHECLHAVFAMTGLESEWGARKEEAVVRRLSPVLLDLLRRNPDLVAYLTAKEA